ncbi:IS21 family transposase [Corynebacterium halotolerans]|uniref:IS21 family transposase n=1 Tax=Corynebacterium halotolerans TaxID=225326 RepID=UPI003CF968EE
MTNYRLIMQLLLGGSSYRDTQARCGAAHATIAKARKTLDHHKITTPAQLDGYHDDDLHALVGDGRMSLRGEFVPIDMDTVLAARTGRKKTPLNILWADYLTVPSAGLRHYSYERFRQLVGQEVQVRGLTARIQHAPGHTMQVDWAGTKMRLTDSVTRRTTSISVFVATLPYSGMVFACGCVDERQPNWLAAHRHAFEYFGGVAEVIVPDNASTASNAIRPGDRARKVNASYEEFLTHYNTAALPTRPVKPKDKGNVEAGVKVITNWAIRRLADREFTNLDDLNTALRAAVEEINDRTPFRDQQLSRRQIFHEAEADLLAVLPDQPFLPTVWKKTKVTPDWHITIATVHYSVPYQHVGDTVDVRIRGDQLEVFAGNATIATHTVGTQRGAYVTDVAHCPLGMEDANSPWSSQYFLTQASRVGPHTQKAIADLLASRPIVAQAYLPARNILAMGKGDNKSILEEACRRLVDESTRRRAISYTAVKNMMAAVRSDQTTRPATTVPAPRTQARSTPPPHLPGDRGGLLGGASQFSLQALTGTSGNKEESK